MKTDSRRLNLTLACGDILQVNAQAIVLGIFRDVTPTGASRVIDHRLSSAITDASNRGMFNSNVGEIFILPVSRGLLKAEFVLFAGLGPYGEFKDADGKALHRVAEHVMRTLVRCDVSDFATVLIAGSSGVALHNLLENTMTGFLDGLVDSDIFCRFRSITLCENNEARYKEICTEMEELKKKGLFKNPPIMIDKLKFPDSGPAAGPAALADRIPDPVYLTIEKVFIPDMKDDKELFRSSVMTAGDKATVLSKTQPVSKADIHDLQEKIKIDLSSENMEKYGSSLADKFLHADIQRALSKEANNGPLVLVHDDEASRLPWEMLCIKGTFITCENGMHRRYRAENMPVGKWLDKRQKNGTINMLLVVNPTGDLPSAIEEGKRIKSLLKKDEVTITTRWEKDATKERLLDDFSSGQYDIVHYAGHAYFNTAHPTHSGILCANKKVLCGEDLAQINHLPSLVFFNACEAARIRGEWLKKILKNLPNNRYEGLKYTASFAEAFLRGGVANYIGTYWPVNDRAASLFAQTFYAGLVTGQTIGTSLLSARKELRREENKDWANYIHFGNQSFII